MKKFLALAFTLFVAACCFGASIKENPLTTNAYPVIPSIASTNVAGYGALYCVAVPIGGGLYALRSIELTNLFHTPIEFIMANHTRLFTDSPSGQRGYIDFWADHGNGLGLLALGGGDVDLLPGETGTVQIGTSGGNDGSQMAIQYRNSPIITDPLGHSHVIEFRSKRVITVSGSTNILSANNARPGIQGWASVTNDSVQLGELRFYARVPDWANGNGTSTPTTAGVEVFRANTQGVVAAASRKFIGDGSGLTNLNVVITNGLDGRGLRGSNVITSTINIDFAAPKVFEFGNGPAVGTITLAVVNDTTPAGAFDRLEVIIRAGYNARTLVVPAWANASAINTALGFGKMVRFQLDSYGLGNSNKFVVSSVTTDDLTTPADSDAAGAITAGSITDPATIDAIYRLVAGHKANALWPLAKRIWPMAGGTATSTAIDVVSAGVNNITWNGSPTHSANGVQGTGLSGCYGNTGFTPSSGFASANDSAYFVYVGSSNVLTGTLLGVANNSGSARAEIDASFNAGQSQVSGYVNSGVGGPSLQGSCDSHNTDHRGSILMQRTAAGTQEIYWRGACFASNGDAATSLPDTAVALLGRNFNGFGVDLNSDAQLRGGGIYTKMTSGQAAILNTLWTEFNTRLSRNAP